MSVTNAFTAYSRFGLGTRPGDLASLGTDPKAALLAEIADPTSLFLPDADLPSGVDAFTEVREFQKARQAQKRQADASAAGGNMTSAEPAAGDAMGDNAKPAARPNARQIAKRLGLVDPSQLLNAEVAARVDRVHDANIGFGERLVAFWANHFAVQAATNEVVRGLAGAFEREAIRPFALGKFADMALAATQHPAMLTSLNNATSIGPNSPQGLKNGKGLNENHARELMELHTVGVDAGYTQADVTSFAKVLTGWTFGQAEKDPESYGRFVFRKQAHEPGPQTVMGKTYAQKGADQGEAVIAALARHPATAKHIATKLATYFVADAPPQSLVDRLAATFETTDGDLKAVTLALVNSPEAWAAPAEKLKTPQEFLWSALRALTLDVPPNLVNRTLADLGQPLWNPPSPQGWKDDTATWLAPDAMTTRVDTAEVLASQAKSIADPRQLAADLFGESLSPETRTAIDRAESRDQALAMLLMSPEFQRR